MSPAQASTMPKPLGVAADTDWAQRALAAYNALPHGSKQNVARALGVRPTHLSKIIRRGSGRPEFIMAASRALHIAPPHRLVDQQQWELLDALEKFRAGVESLHGPIAVEQESSGLIRRVAAIATALLAHGSSADVLSRLSKRDDDDGDG